MLFPSPLRDLSPKTFAFKEFNDVRDVEDPTRMMKVGVHTFDLEDPPAILVAQWIQSEFERNGHRCVPDSRTAKADFLVEGTVFKFYVRRNVGWTSLTDTAETGVKVTISRLAANAGSLTKTYQATRSMASGAIAGDLWRSAIHQALMATLHEMSTDPELMEFLSK